MCRFSKEYAECDGQHEECYDLGRRSLEQFLETHENVTQQLPSLQDLSANHSTLDIPLRTQSLSDEIDNLIKWNREKSTIQ